MMKKIGIGCLGLISVCLVIILFFVVKYDVFNNDSLGYSVTKNKVQYKYFSMSSYLPTIVDLATADVNTFEVIPNSYGKNGKYAKDKFQVYYNGEILAGANPATFKVLGKNMSTDGISVFRRADKISDDPEHFKFNGSVSRDRKYVYYNSDTIHNADPNTYKRVGGKYKLGIDKDHVFCNNKLMPNSDAKTFKLLGNFHWKDKSGVYTNGCKKTSIDQRTVIFLKKNTSFFRDKDHIYYHDKIIAQADRKSFRVLNNAYSKDKEHVYYTDKLIPGVDVSSFRALGAMYAKDEEHVYFKQNIVVGADVKTFKSERISEFAGGVHYSDKHGKFHKGERVKE